MVIAHPVIQIFNLQRFMRRRMDPEIHEFRRVEIRGDFLRAVFEEASDIADLLHFRLVLLIGSVLVLATYDPVRAADHRRHHDRHGRRVQHPDGSVRQPDPRLANCYSAVAVAAAALRRIEDVTEPRSPRITAPRRAAPPRHRPSARGITYEVQLRVRPDAHPPATCRSDPGRHAAPRSSDRPAPARRRSST